MTYADERWTDLGDQLTRRMRVCGLSQSELVERSGVSDFTVRKLMKGTEGNYRPDRLTKVAIALGWRPDALHQILEGLPPEEARAADPLPGHASTYGQDPEHIAPIMKGWPASWLVELERASEDLTNREKRMLVDGAVRIAARRQREANLRNQQVFDFGGLRAADDGLDPEDAADGGTDIRPRGLSPIEQDDT